MTGREEIERLLNQTGRTLEGLPKEYPSDRCRAVGRAHGLTPAVAGNSLLHQSDVIELLVAALRDALEMTIAGKEGNERTNETEDNRL